MVMSRFTGKAVAITGGAGGIGRACGQRFAAEGARVALLDIDKAAAEQAATPINGLAVACDVSNAASVSAAIETVLKRWDRLDVLVANAGIYRSSALADLSLTDWQLVLDVNLTGAMLCCQAAAPAMIEQGGGSIVVMSSMAGKTSWPASAAYSASKTGAIGLVRSIAQELGPYNVNCNAVCLGHADTEMLRAVDQRVCAEEGWAPGTFLRNLAQSNPMRRLARLDEVAALVAFLASEEGHYVNGQSIELDGGLVMS
jgi:NAD(P)-dependent dehydrogenase (short-subunit alcohol dehydrogenase family)